MRHYAAVYVDGSGSVAATSNRTVRALVIQRLNTGDRPMHSFSTEVDEDVTALPAEGTNMRACVDHSRKKYGPNARILVVVDEVDGYYGEAPERVTVKSFHEILET